MRPLRGSLLTISSSQGTDARSGTAERCVIDMTSLTAFQTYHCMLSDSPPERRRIPIRLQQELPLSVFRRPPCTARPSAHLESRSPDRRNEDKRCEPSPIHSTVVPRLLN